MWSFPGWNNLIYLPVTASWSSFLILLANDSFSRLLDLVNLSSDSTSSTCQLRNKTILFITFFHTGKSHLICTFRLITIICTVSGRKGIPFCMIQVHLHCHFTFNLALSYFDMDSSRSLSRFFKSNCNFTFSFSFWFASVYVQQKAYINNNENKILHKSGFICIRDVNIFDMFFVYLYFWQPVFCFGDFLFILYFFFKPLFLTVFASVPTDFKRLHSKTALRSHGSDFFQQQMKAKMNDCSYFVETKWGVSLFCSAAFDFRVYLPVILHLFSLISTVLPT